MIWPQVIFNAIIESTAEWNLVSLWGIALVHLLQQENEFETTVIMVHMYQVIMLSKRHHLLWLSPCLSAQFCVCVRNREKEKERFPPNSNGTPLKCKERLQSALVSDISFFFKLPNFGSFCFRNYFQLLKFKKTLNQGFGWLQAFQFTFCILCQNPQEHVIHNILNVTFILQD